MRTLPLIEIKRATRLALRLANAGVEGIGIEYAELDGMPPFLLVFETAAAPAECRFTGEIESSFDSMQESIKAMLAANKIILTE